jgi:hypothetical protein
MFRLRHATPSQRANFLPATVSFFHDPQFFPVLSFGF